MTGEILRHVNKLSGGKGRRRRPPREAELGVFLGRWLKAPHRIGALAPSSRHLGRAMAHQVVSAGPGPIIELGGGTGSVTKALLEAGIAPERLVVVERDEKLHRILREPFP